MSTVRRWYIYLVAAISLQGVTWAIIALLRQLLLSPIRIDREFLALQLAVIIIGLPLFLLHWLWAQRLTRSDEEERQAALRYLYIYGNIAGALIPILTNAFDLVGSVIGADLVEIRQPSSLGTGWAVLYHLIPIIILAFLSYYHFLLLREAAGERQNSGHPALIRRIFVLGFSAGGVTMLTLVIINVSNWLLIQFEGQTIGQPFLNISLNSEITRLVIALPLWLFFWQWARRLFKSEAREERHSALRKLYLYAAIFIGAISVISSLTLILAGIFRRLLALPAQGTLRTAIATIIGTGLVWLYHSFVLRSEDEAVAEQPRQASIRRLYYYLVAAIGLLALLIGLAGNIYTAIFILDSGITDFFREQISYFSAAIISGLVVWLLPWRQILKRTKGRSEPHYAERSSLVRKIYLYLYLFVATMTILGSTISLVFNFLLALLAVEPLSWTAIGQATALAIIGAAVALYHGLLLREDWQQLKLLAGDKIKALRIAYLGRSSSPFASLLNEQFSLRFSGARLELLDSTEAADPDAIIDEEQGVAARLVELDLLIAPVGLTSTAHPSLDSALKSTPAHKFMLPLAVENGDWIGVTRQDTTDYVQQTLNGIEQFLAGEEIEPRSQMGVGSIIASVVGGTLLLIFVIAFVSSVISLFS